MNHCAIQKSAFSTHEEIRSSIYVPLAERRDPVVCPKPRRLVQFADHPFRPSRKLLSYQSELCDSKAGTDLFDIFVSTGGYGKMEQSLFTPAASSPPIFCGSPPSRVANPLIQDARFGDEKLSPFSSAMPIPPPSGLSSFPTSSARKGGCVRTNFGSNPAVRIEGFDCLDRDCRSCSIPALA